MNASAASRKLLGERAEAVAAAHLAANGLEIVARNVRVGRLEIDILAREGRVVALVEVRTRGAGSYQRPLDSIDAKKQARLRDAGERLWRARFADDAAYDRLRYDAATVTFDPAGAATVEHVRAFLTA